MIDRHLKNCVQSVSLRQNPAPPLTLQIPSVSGNPLISNIMARAASITHSHLFTIFIVKIIRKLKVTYHVVPRLFQLGCHCHWPLLSSP